MAVTWCSWQYWNRSGCYGSPGMLSSTSSNMHTHRRTQAWRWAEPARVSAECWPDVGPDIDRPIDHWPKLGWRPPANLLFPNSFAMARVLSLWRSIEKKSLNLRLEGRWVGINTKIHRPFVSLELARCVKHQTHARHACRVVGSNLD